MSRCQARRAGVPGAGRGAAGGPGHRATPSPRRAQRLRAHDGVAGQGLREAPLPLPRLCAEPKCVPASQEVPHCGRTAAQAVCRALQHLASRCDTVVPPQRRRVPRGPLLPAPQPACSTRTSGTARATRQRRATWSSWTGAATPLAITDGPWRPGTRCGALERCLVAAVGCTPAASNGPFGQSVGSAVHAGQGRGDGPRAVCARAATPGGTIVLARGRCTRRKALSHTCASNQVEEG